MPINKEAKMRRTKEWWATLDKEERSHLVYIERRMNGFTGYGGYLPDDCSECPVCGQPVFGSGMCSYCSNSRYKYIDKADKALEGSRK
jgi:hypothetical protein